VGRKKERIFLLKFPLFCVFDIWKLNVALDIPIMLFHPIEKNKSKSEK